MGTVASLQVVIGAKIDGLRKEIDSAQKILKQKFGSKGLGISQSSLEVLGGLGLAIAGVGAAAVHASAQMEQTRKAFNTLLKDATLAKDFLAELENFAASTPFELPGLLDASKKMLAFGFTAQQVIPILTAVGDSAAALGMGQDGINRLTLAIGQMQAKGKVSAEEMLQLAEAGVPAWQMLADAMGTSIPEAMKLAEKGAIDSATGIQAVISGMNSKFGGMMQEQASTINGMLSNIRDSIGQTMVVVGDNITEALDLKPALKVAQDDLFDFAAKVKSSGVSEAIRGTVPSAVGATIAGFATVLVATAIPALVKLGLTAAGATAAFIGMTGPIALAAAGVGAAAYLIWDNWEWVGKQWDELCWSIELAAGRMAAAVKAVIAGVVGNIGWLADKIASFVGGSGITDEMRRRAEDFKLQIDIELANLEAQDMMRKWEVPVAKQQDDKKPFENADVNNLGLKSSNLAGSSGSAGGASGLDSITKEINKINEQLNSAKEKTLDLQRDYNNFVLDIEIGGMDEWEKVYANILKEKEQRLVAVDEWQKRFTNATTEAQQLYERAMKTGDANAIASTAAMLEQRKAMEVKAAQEAAVIREQIDTETTERLKSNATNLQAYKAELDEIQRQGDLERYLAYLDAEKAAFLAHMAENQEIMSTYYQWRMEAESTYLGFAVQAADTLKNGLASAFSGAIVYGNSLSKSIKDLSKQIVAMFIEWQVRRIASGALSDMLLEAETGKSIALAGQEAAAWTPAAIAYETLHPGSIARASTSVLGAMSAGASGALGIVSCFGPKSQGIGKGSMSFGSGGEEFDWGYQEKHLAAGGIVTGPVHALIGEKSYPEAVIPLRSSVLESLASFMIGDSEVAMAGNTQVNAALNIYGDINTGSDEEDMYESFGSTILSAIRGRK